MTDKTQGVSRRTVLKGTAASAAAIAVPSFYIPTASAAGSFRNDPKASGKCVLGLSYGDFWCTGKRKDGVSC